MRSPTYEQVLTKEGVQFEYMERLDLNAIDVKKSERNQARLVEPFVAELIEQYTGFYKDGFEGPPLVVWRVRNKNSWVIIDGNQRTQAAKEAGRKTLDAYCVTTDEPMVVDRLTWTFNNKVNGRRLTYEESIEHAKSFVRKYGIPAEHAAKEWGVNKKTLWAAIKGDELRDLLRDNKVPVTPALNTTILNQLASLRKVGDDVFVLAAEAVAKSGANQDDVAVMIKGVGQAKTHQDKVKVVAEFAVSEPVRRRAAETKCGTRKPTSVPYEQLDRLLVQALRLLSDYPDMAFKPGKPRYDQVRGNAADVCDRLTVLYGLGARCKQGGVG